MMNEELPELAPIAMGLVSSNSSLIIHRSSFIIACGSPDYATLSHYEAISQDFVFDSPALGVADGGLFDAAGKRQRYGQQQCDD
jgi:hypothetical protein